MTWRPGSSRHLSLRWAGIATLCCLVAALVHTRVAGAGPVDDQRAQAAQLAAQLTMDGRRADQLSEQYDGARLHQQAVDAELARTRSALAAADARTTEVGAKLRDVAVGAYIRSGRPVTMSLADPGDVFLAALGQTYETVAAGDEQGALQAARALRVTLTAQRTALEGASRDAQRAAAATARLRDAAAAAAAQEQMLLAKATGGLGALVAQEQARQQARQGTQVQADLQARTAGGAASRGQVIGLPTPPPSPLVPTPAPSPPASSAAATALAVAEAQLGKPYRWGAAGPSSFDCSGLTMFAWGAAGVALPHYTGAQYAATTHIPLSALQPGDLVFFYGDLSHVGIYVGGGMFIHAPHSGTVVSFSSIYQMGTTAIFASRVG